MDQMDNEEHSSTSPIVAGASIDDLVERLRSRVVERRDNGEYPEGLEESLDAHFRRIVSHRVRPDASVLRTSVQAFDERTRIEPREVAADSGVPGGEMLHRVLNKAMLRHRQVLQEQLDELSAAMRDIVRVLADAVEDPATHVHSDLVGRLDAVLERLDSYERRPVDEAAAVGDLRRRVEQLEQAVASGASRRSDGAGTKIATASESATASAAESTPAS